MPWKKNEPCSMQKGIKTLSDMLLSENRQGIVIFLKPHPEFLK